MLLKVLALLLCFVSLHAAVEADEDQQTGSLRGRNLDGVPETDGHIFFAAAFHPMPENGRSAGTNELRATEEAFYKALSERLEGTNYATGPLSIVKTYRNSYGRRRLGLFVPDFVCNLGSAVCGRRRLEGRGLSYCTADNLDQRRLVTNEEFDKLEQILNEGSDDGTMSGSFEMTDVDEEHRALKKINIACKAATKYGLKDIPLYKDVHCLCITVSNGEKSLTHNCQDNTMTASECKKYCPTEAGLSLIEYGDDQGVTSITSVATP